MKICGTSALSLRRNKCSTYQNCHGWRWFYAVACLYRKHVAQKCTGRTFLGVSPLYFGSAPSICGVCFQKHGSKIYGTSALSLRRNKYSTYQNRHGWRWFYAVACLYRKHVAQKCTGRTFLGVSPLYFGSAPSICGVCFQKPSSKIYGTSTASHH